MAYIRQNGLPLALAAAVALVTMATALTRGLHPVQAPASPSISIQDDRFYLDGEPFQIISGAIHYFRVHPDLWGDRLVRLRAMGLNTVEVYVPWNFHEPYPGQYTFTGMADLDGFITLAEDLGFMVLVRAGPYMCGEFEFGGFPWWLGSSAVAGGGTMRLRSSDPAYLAHVDRWWQVLFARLKPRLRANGGPVLMVQVENEYGFCGSDKDYLHHLVAKAREYLGPEVLLYTTDPAHVAAAGTVVGGDVLTTVDFGPGWFYPDSYYAVQKELNAPGASPPIDSEFYTGWLTHWGEPMANTSTADLANDTTILLKWGNNTGNLNFYMAHGGTNFGFWAGANVDGEVYQPHITSYDYDAPVSEAGDYCQPGIGGGCKFHALRDAISAFTGIQPPPVPLRPTIRAYTDAPITMSRVGSLLASPETFSGGPPRRSEAPLPMEEYGQRWGLILYRTTIPAAALQNGAAELDLGAVVHDYASVYIGGQMAGRMQRTGPANLTLRAPAGTVLEGSLTLDIFVEGMGRQNFGCDAFGAWDYKGLQSKDVRLNGELISGWSVYNFELDDVTNLPEAEDAPEAATARRLLQGGHLQDDAPAPPEPTFYSGTLDISGEDAAMVTNAAGGKHLACTYLDTTGWGKGVAFVNGFNLGWYWPSMGPQMTLYVPGPILRPGKNQVVFLEVEAQPTTPTVSFTDQANFYGPSGRGGAAVVGSAGPRFGMLKGKATGGP